MTDGLATPLTLLVLGTLGFRLARGAQIARSTRGRAMVAAILRRITWQAIWPIPFVLAAIVGAAFVLVQIPGLSWGWWSALGGEGNPVFGSTDSTRGTAWEWLVPALFVAMLIPALPLFAYAEERIFREGAEAWSAGRRALKVLAFGLVHALIGIPIGAALALSIGGAYFMAVYLTTFRTSRSRREATLQSAAAHTAYNGVIVAFVILLTISVAVGG